MQNKYLPVGSVVKLVENAPKVMISGFNAKSNKSGIVYDYFGILYPNGYKEDDDFILFNHSQIIELCFVGASSDSDFIKLNKEMLG